MNDILLAVDAYDQPNLYYMDTDSVYIPMHLFDKLVDSKLVGNDLFQGKDDYGVFKGGEKLGGIVYGLYIASKIKWNLILTTDGFLFEKQSFKGFNKAILTSDKFFNLYAGETVEEEFVKTWEKSFSKGVRFTDKDKIEEKNGKKVKVNVTQKKFRSEVNLLKRKSPDDDGIMYPYYVEKIPKKDETVPLDHEIELDLEDGRYMLYVPEDDSVGDEL